MWLRADARPARHERAPTVQRGSARCSQRSKQPLAHRQRAQITPSSASISAMRTGVDQPWRCGRPRPRWASSAPPSASTPTTRQASQLALGASRSGAAGVKARWWTGRLTPHHGKASTTSLTPHRRDHPAPSTASRSETNILALRRRGRSGAAPASRPRPRWWPAVRSLRAACQRTQSLITASVEQVEQSNALATRSRLDHGRHRQLDPPRQHLS